MAKPRKAGKNARPGLKAPKRGKGSGSKKIAKKIQAVGGAGGVVKLVSLVEKRRAEEG